MIHASRIAGSQGVEGASGTVDGDAGGVTGNVPGLSLTESFYRIRGYTLDAFGAGASKFDSDAQVAAA